MSKKNKYTELCKAMKEKVQAAGGTRYSETDRTLLTLTALNTPDHEVDVYMNDSEEPVTLKPVEAYRESLKPVLEQFGIDKADQDRIQDIEFSNKHAKALNDLSDVLNKDYMENGRKLILPTTAKDQAQMEISIVEKPQKSEDTRKPVEVEPGVYKSVPTGERRHTAPHMEIKASNKIPGWLVTKEKIEE